MVFLAEKRNFLAASCCSVLVVNGGFEVKSLKALVDKELPKYVKDMHGKEVLYPSELQNIQIDIIVIASRTYEDEIISEINSMNLDSKSA